MSYNVGDTLCSCTLLQKCGEGAYGEVWLACDAIGARVALKILYERNCYSERELAGLKNYKDCNHPNLLKIRYVEIAEKQICYTMDAADDLNSGIGEYLPDTLTNRLNKFGRLDGKEISAMLDGLLSGLEELHKNGLVHRDIKPDNILWVNGRATLADVGLITGDGAGSVVGTPGFISPQVLAGYPAEASDDFYALGKVIYCALTGFAVSEYPSLPADVTISMDANLNKALRESCSHPVCSAAEFRELLAGKWIAAPPQKINFKRHLPLKQIFSVLLFAALLGSLFYLFDQQKKVNAKHISQVLAIDQKSEEKFKKLQNVDNDFKDELQAEVQAFFRKNGWLDSPDRLPLLLNYKPVRGSEVLNLILSDDNDPRLEASDGVFRKTAKMTVALEIRLAGMFHAVSYPDFDEAKVKERQSYWRSRGDIKSMLTEDPIMQAVVLDAVIRKAINKVLEQGSLMENEEAVLKDWIDLRHALLDPEWGKLEYISRNFH